MRQEGSSIDTIEEQPEKAPSPRLVRLAGSSIDINYRSKSKDGTGRHLGGPENADIEAGGQRDRRQRGAAIEGVTAEAREAGGQLD
jgi:hypothetical protein